jgi:hypothetical protein
VSKKETPSRTETPAKGPSLAALLPLIFFVLVLAAGGVFAMKQQANLRNQVADRQKTNESLGLPRDYPLELVPLYKDLKILETERGTADATDGAVMNKWVPKGESPAEKDLIYQYYNNLLLDKGMRQTMYISIPQGVGVNFGDEKNIVEFEIERPADSVMTNVKITVYTTAREP